MKIDFNFVPKESNSFGFNNSSVEINVPTKLKKGLFINSLSYSKYKINYTSTESINTDYLESFNSIEYSLKYLNILNSNWSYSVEISPTVSSNFESKILFKDVILNGELVFKRKLKVGSFQIGLLKNSNVGFKNLVPVISYSSSINDNINYTLGFPQSKVQYKLNSTNSLNLYIKPKGFYANLSDAIMLNSFEEAEKALFQSVITGLNYIHKIDDYWKISLDAGYQLKADYKLLNNNRSVYEFNSKNKLYMGLNLKFDLLKCKK
ncbi:DUF6268 family outer membrane beta-barrel protein [uncultured Lutibacter sp.]|uniref:DUF6268 family outer membrane beta-barrel protein n=1 Tax=uncultured Lutibacter sp. TaxID=437739 RepID=UPI0026368627|nr:DUF6268 family outer membrane beta-barrel protein [uncultured Lutibacter sp.]